MSNRKLRVIRYVSLAVSFLIACSLVVPAGPYKNAVDLPSVGVLGLVIVMVILFVTGIAIGDHFEGLRAEERRYRQEVAERRAIATLRNLTRKS